MDINDRIKIVFNTTDASVEKVVREILKIENQRKHLKNISSNVPLEKEIANEIIKVIQEEVRK